MEGIGVPRRWRCGPAVARGRRGVLATPEALDPPAVLIKALTLRTGDWAQAILGEAVERRGAHQKLFTFHLGSLLLQGGRPKGDSGRTGSSSVRRSRMRQVSPRRCPF